MTDYYTKFCICIPLRTEAEKAWWTDAELIYVPALWGSSLDDVEQKKSDTFFEKYPYIWNNHEGSTLCEISLEKDSRFPFGAVYVSDDGGSGDIDGVGSMIQAFLKDCDISKPVAFQWGEDCSRHCPDGFGGGVCFVTRENVELHSTYGLIEDWVTKLTIPLTVNYHDQAPYGIGNVEEPCDAEP